MSKKRRAKSKSKQAATKASAQTAGASTSALAFLTSMTRRRLVTTAVGIVALLLAAVSIHAYESGQQELHDLGVIGQGVPVIVQIHDPNCPTCRRLKKLVTEALESNDSVLYRLANIRTDEGKALQNKYSVPHVTLLYFNAEGRHVHTTTGLQSPTQVRRAVNRYFVGAT
jgi:thiol-disulfide isomerase/thioredoxin